jgi:hypothetical protein
MKAFVALGCGYLLQLIGFQQDSYGNFLGVG